jgi:hypothetical protein
VVPDFPYRNILHHRHVLPPRQIFDHNLVMLLTDHVGASTLPLLSHTSVKRPRTVRVHHVIFHAGGGSINVASLILHHLRCREVYSAGHYLIVLFQHAYFTYVNAHSFFSSSSSTPF